MKASAGMRIWFALFAVIILIGIYLTGFSNVHWFLYVPVAGFLFAAITGICPSMGLTAKIAGSK